MEHMSHRRRRYRFVIDGAVSSQFADAFPHLVEIDRRGSVRVLEGPVLDPTQLAGIVSNICHHNTCILRVEALDDDSDLDAVASAGRSS